MTTSNYEWQRYDTVLYSLEKPEHASVSKVYQFKLSEIVTFLYNENTPSPHNAKIDTENMRITLLFRDSTKQIQDLPVAKCIRNNAYYTDTCKQLEKKIWKWKTDLTKNFLNFLMEQGISILITVPGSSDLTVLYSIKYLIEQIFNELDFQPSVFVTTSNETDVQHVFKNVTNLSNITFVLGAKEIPSLPKPTFPSQPELIITCGTSESGFDTYEFPKRYIIFKTPVKYTEIVPHIGLHMVILGKNLTYGERSIYIKYGVLMNIPVRIFWFSKMSYTEKVQVPTLSTEGVEIVEIN